MAYFMAPKKTATLNLRIDPSLKEALRTAAEAEHRHADEGRCGMTETLIRKHCEENGIPMLEQHSLFGGAKDE